LISMEYKLGTLPAQQEWKQCRLPNRQFIKLTFLDKNAPTISDLGLIGFLIPIRSIICMNLTCTDFVNSHGPFIYAFLPPSSPMVADFRRHHHRAWFGSQVGSNMASSDPCTHRLKIALFGSIYTYIAGVHEHGYRQFMYGW
jgi:hypothetical protein